MSVNHKLNERISSLNKRLKNLEQSSEFNSNSVPAKDNLNLKIRVLIVDDLRLMLEGLTAIFSDDENIEIVGFAHNGEEAITQVKELQPDVVVMDLLMPIMGGVEATKLISQQFLDVKILILSSFEDEASVSEVLLAGAHGYALKSTVSQQLAQAIRSVQNGSYHFAPGILDNLAKAASKNLDPKLNSANKATQKIATISSNNSPSTSETRASQNQAAVKNQAIVKKETEEAKNIPVKTITAKKTNPKAKKSKAPKPEKPLFPYGDWAVVIFGVIILSRTDGMGHHLGHAGLFLLMLALLARSIKSLWSQPLKYRRAIGIFAFAATVAHAIYATKNILDGNLLNMFNLSTMHLWGLWAGIISLGLMAPAAATSFQSMQRKLGKSWRQIHLLTVPSLTLAVFHTILIGPHYLADFNHYLANSSLDIIDHTRAYVMIAVCMVVLLVRNKTFMSLVKTEKTSKLFSSLKYRKTGKLSNN